MRALLVATDATTWSEFSAIAFALLFVCLAVWVYLPSRNKEFQRAERLPLDN